MANSNFNFEASDLHGSRVELWRQKIGAAKVDYISKRMTNKLIAYAQETVTQITPMSKKTMGQHMRNKWYNSPAQKYGVDWKGKVANKATSKDFRPYGLYVNYGHRIVRKGLTVGYEPPQFFLEKAIKETNSNMKLLINPMFNDFIHKTLS